MQSLFSHQAGAAVVRRPAVAGRFYPAPPTELERTVRGLLDRASCPPIAPVRGLIAPHAGYVCSGPVAACAFRQLRRLPEADYTVYLLGPAHWHPVRGVALTGVDAFATPLGTIPVATEKVATLASLGAQYVINDAAHEPEHSLEVELPFLQLTLERFAIVPMLFGEYADTRQVAEDLFRLVGDDPNSLIVVSSDLSHYHPQGQANALDRRYLDGVLNGDVHSALAGEACGRMGIATLMQVAALAGWHPHLLAYGDSSQTCGPADRVVGYGAVAYAKGED
jgi:AmmeMemoRadiSam system protein B